MSAKLSTSKIIEEEKHQEVDSNSIVPFDDFISGLNSWGPLLKNFTSQKKMKNIYDYVKKEYSAKTCYPPANLVFNAFQLTPINKIKVVIVGQDPYINNNEAMGLCFSVPRSQKKIPPSLQNIYKGLVADIPGFKHPGHGDLTKWAQQGVFLLNAVLTVEAKKSNSHKDCGWVDFTDEVIRVIDKDLEKIVFLLWGGPAQKKAKKVDRKKHVVLQTSHPSPLSAHQGFLTSQCFKKCNEELEKLGKEPINWNLS